MPVMATIRPPTSRGSHTRAAAGHGKRAARGGIGDHPGDEPLLGVVGIGLLRLPPGEDGAGREHQQAEAEPQAIARRALAMVLQTGVAQNRDYHQTHHQAHDDRAGEVRGGDKPGPGGAEVDG